MITTQELAKILSEEFERDSWGDIDPFWLRLVAGEFGDYSDQDSAEDADALRDVLHRVCHRLNFTG